METLDAETIELTGDRVDLVLARHQEVVAAEVALEAEVASRHFVRRNRPMGAPARGGEAGRLREELVNARLAERAALDLAGCGSFGDFLLQVRS